VEPLFYFQHASGRPGKFSVYFSQLAVYRPGDMNWSQLTNGVKQIWENRPGVVVLLGIGFLVFIFIVIDARRHRKKTKDKHPKKY
jgi:hypothetical protein